MADRKPHPAPRPAQDPAPPLLDEADIGSGERTPAQHETDAIIAKIPALPPEADRQPPQPPPPNPGPAAHPAP